MSDRTCSPQPEYMATQHPSGRSPLLAIQASMSSGVSWVSGSSAALAAMSTTTSGTTSCSTGIASAVFWSAEKWMGASMWVPVCSTMCHLYWL
jgi:hypothetical protein